MTIRAKLYAAIVLTILGPLATTAVALHGMGQMGDRFDEVQERARHESIALQLKFGVTDVNGWQTAYGYDDGRSRPVFERAAAAFGRELRLATRALRDPRERALIANLTSEFEEFMRLDRVAYRALRAGDERAFDEARDDARKRLIAVALGAGIVIVLLLVTASDVARMALEGERNARGRSDD